MKILGELHITFDREPNRYGQRPLEITFVGPDGMRLGVIGVRAKEGHVLDAQATSPRGWPIYHTQFSPELQSAIIRAISGEPAPAVHDDSEAKKRASDEYQRQTTERMMKLRDARMA